jgi:hypothetical protein
MNQVLTMYPHSLFQASFYHIRAFMVVFLDGCVFYMNYYALGVSFFSQG